MSFLRATSGAAALEAAMVFPVYLLFVFGILEVGYGYWEVNSMQYAADEASRCNAVSNGGGAWPKIASTQTPAINRATGVNLAATDISVTSNTTCKTSNGSFTGTLVQIRHTNVPLTATAIPGLERIYVKIGSVANFDVQFNIESCYPNPS